MIYTTPPPGPGKETPKASAKPRRPQREQAAREMLLKDLTYLYRETWIPNMMADETPDAWHTLLHDLDVEAKKQKVTLYLDRPVAKFFRDMGLGYQARINRVLSTFVQMHAAKQVRLEDMLNERIASNAPEDAVWAGWDGMMAR